MKRITEVLAEIGLEEVPLALECVASDPVPARAPARARSPARVEDQDQSALARRLRGWGAPELAVRLITERRLAETESVRAVRRLIEAAHQGAIWCCLAGPVGSGKTTAATLWLAQVQGRGGPRALIASERIARLPANTVHTETRFEELVSAAALVLDDLGRRDLVQGVRGNEVAPLVQALLCERYDARRPTLLTANVDQARLVQLLGDERMGSRWGEVGRYAAVSQVVRGRSR